MCDYSLMAIPNRLANPGEELIIHKFEAGARGLAAASDLRRGRECRGFWPTLKKFFIGPDTSSVPAVCIPPGARLLVRDISAKLQREGRFHGEVKEAVFTELTADVNTFRDAFRFRNGVELSLQRFSEGQRVRVLSLSAADGQGRAREESQPVRM